MTHPHKMALQLTRELALAKQREVAARDERWRIEAQIVAALGFDKKSGSESFMFGEGDGAAKITLRQPVTLKFDADAYKQARSGLPVKARRCVRQKLEIDTKAFNELKDNDSKAYAQLAEFVERRPGKVAVVIDQLLETGGAADGN